MISFTLKILLAALVLCYSNLGFFILQPFFETMPHEARRRNLKVYISSALDSLIVEIVSVFQQFQVTFSFIDRTTPVVELKFLEPFFLVTVQPTVAQSQRPCLTLNLWVPPDFCLFRFLEEKAGQEFLCVFALMVTIKEPDQEEFAYRNEISHCKSLYTCQLAVNFIHWCQCTLRS